MRLNPPRTNAFRSICCIHICLSDRLIRGSSLHSNALSSKQETKTEYRSKTSELKALSTTLGNFNNRIVIININVYEFLHSD